MKTIAHRQLRNESGRILRDVQQGETYRITNHGEVVAILSPPTETVTLRIRPARNRGGFADMPRVKLDHPIQETLDDLRGER